jgi:hypothetical protein
MQIRNAAGSSGAQRTATAEPAVPDPALWGVSFAAVLAAVQARGPRCIRCRAWTMDPDQTPYTHPMCDRCATTLEALRIRFRGVSGPAHLPTAARPAHRSGPVCQTCSSWQCAHCGWKRRENAWLDCKQTCKNCGRGEGQRAPVRHRSHRWYVHNVMMKRV